MGYYTYYGLTVTGAEDAAIIKALSECGYGMLVDRPSLSAMLEEQMTWYDHEAHMVAISQRFPAATFVLRGDGADPGDVWRKTFTNGDVRTQKARMVFDD